ncbi:MAG: GFA family protein [Pseudomonadota bacterium]
MTDKESPSITGRCYCGQITIAATKTPQAITYCHCEDCRRTTGSPVAVFAAFADADLTLTPNEGQKVSVTPGVTRSFCSNCGTPLTGRYDYLPGMVYVGVAVLDQADELEPQLHAHESQRLPWLHIQDNLERFPNSARSKLKSANKS